LSRKSRLVFVIDVERFVSLVRSLRPPALAPHEVAE
jgi:hypothetical protein